MDEDKQGDIIDAIVAAVLGPGRRLSPGCPTLGKKEALAVLAFVRAVRGKEDGREDGAKQGNSSV